MAAEDRDEEGWRKEKKEMYLTQVCSRRSRKTERDVGIEKSFPTCQDLNVQGRARWFMLGDLCQCVCEKQEV